MLFVDGVGLGPDDAARNPFAAGELPGWRALLGAPPVEGEANARPIGLDATLGVAGLPQSGTGQTALVTGVNAPAHVGGHVGPFPTAPLRALLATHGLPAVARAAGLDVALANAYPPGYLERLAAGRGRMDAFARASQLAGVRLRGIDDLRRGAALTAGLTGRGWREQLGIDVPRWSEAEAGAHLAALAARHDLTLFAHYATDAVGHRGDLAAGRRVVARYDRFLTGLLAARSSDLLLVLASDHGNLEEADHGRHTRRPALAGWHGAPLPARWAATTDVAPALRAVLGMAAGAPPADVD